MQSLFRSLSLALTLFLICGRSSHAQQFEAPMLAGWSTLRATAAGSVERRGIPLSGGPALLASPVIAEVDGNPANGNEVVVAGADGNVYAYRADGTLLWQQQTPNFPCRGASSNNKVLSSPAVGRLFGDVPYVVIGYGGPGGNVCPGGVVAYRGPDGVQIWNFNLKKFARRKRFGAISHSVVSTPALADTDGDGRMEIGFGSFDRNVYLLEATGKPRWFYNAADTIWSSASFANVDDDPQLEMIIGTDISRNSRLKPQTFNGGYVYAFKTRSQRGRRLYFRQRGAYVWQTYLDQVVYSSPVVGDVLASNPGPEIVVGSGCFFPQGTNQKGGRWLKVLRLKDGKVLQTLPTGGCLSSSAALADVDGDGIAEVFATVNGGSDIGGDGFGRLMAWKADNPTPLWSVTPRDQGSNNGNLGHFNSPIAADVDGNGSVEILVSNNSNVGIYGGLDGTQYTCADSGCRDGRPALRASRPLSASPAVGDLDGDGLPEVVAAGSAIHVWSSLTQVIGTNAGPRPPFTLAWPHFKGTPTRSGRAP